MNENSPAPEAAAPVDNAATAPSESAAPAGSNDMGLLAEAANAASAKAAANSENVEDASQGKANETGEKPAEDAASAQADSAWKELVDSINPDAGIDAAILQDFANSARDFGLEPEQAKKLLGWQQEVIRRAATEMRDKGYAQLKKEWGDKTDARLNRAFELVHSIDEKHPGFAASLAKFGIVNDAAFIQGLNYLAAELAEDSIAALAQSHAPYHEESPLEGIQNAFKKARGG